MPQRVRIAPILRAALLLVPAMLGAAWRRSRGERRLRGEAERLATLVATQQSVATSGRDPQELMEIVAARAASLAGADGALVAVPDPDLEVRAAAGVHAARGVRRLPPSEVLQRCLREHVTIASADCADDPALAGALGCRSLVVLPLWDGTSTTGLLVVTHAAPGRFGEREEQTLQLLAALASATLSRAEASAAREAALRRLEESEARYGSVVAALHEGVALVGADGAIRTVNASAERILGRAADTLVGLDLLHADLPVLRADGTPMPREELPPIRALREGRPVAGVVLGFDRPDGHRVWLNASSEPLRRDGEALPYAAVVSFTDVTERRASDTALRQALEAAEEANRAKSVFLTTMSHELRTPLNSVIGFASLMLKNKAGTLREQDLVYLRRIAENGQHLLGLINDLLDLSRIEAGRVELQLRPVALDRLVAETLEFLEPQARARDLELGADLPPGLQPIEADASRLRQILLNLAGNALKFTDRGGVLVRVVAEPATGRPLRLDVIDTGIGIPADRLDAVFERFQQVDGTTERRYGGTGLGLAISRQLARLMGFRLDVQSVVGRGSTFSLHFGGPTA